MLRRKPAASPFDYVRDWNAEREARGWWHSFALPDGSVIRGVCTLEGLESRISKFPISQNLSGKRVLDIGTWDGWFAFEMERRGAEVLAIDNWDNPRFHEMRERLGSRAEYRQMDVYDLTPDRIGYFDIVLFMGVIYHLKHPLLALERVCALTKDLAAVDSFVLREKHRRLGGVKSGVEKRPVMEFYETDEFGGQTDNWVGPSLACLMAFCRTAGFARVEHRATMEYNACVACHRKWEPPPVDAPPGPEILEVFHDKNFGINFSTRKDEYMKAQFQSSKRNLTLDDVKPEVEGYGMRPIQLHRCEDDRWEAIFKLPPGLTPGMHEVRLRVGDSAAGGPYSVVVDMPAETESLNITSICDGTTWKEVNPQSGTISLWVTGLPENADKNNVEVRVNGKRLRIDYVNPKRNQINALLDGALQPGLWQVEVSCGTCFSLFPYNVRPMPESPAQR
ncbi:MAG: methyltransferase domain-containing protein [Bryobacteraceae bacterium]